MYCDVKHSSAASLLSLSLCVSSFSAFLPSTPLSSVLASRTVPEQHKLSTDSLLDQDDSLSTQLQDTTTTTSSSSNKKKKKNSTSTDFEDQDPDVRSHWALLAAGSSGWFNYRHQADVFHAYQVLLAGGYHRDHIIVMAADDIAQDPENPMPGKVFNMPGAGQGGREGGGGGGGVRAPWALQVCV